MRIKCKEIFKKEFDNNYYGLFYTGKLPSKKEINSLIKNC